MKIKQYIAAIVAASSMVSCNYLDYTERSGRTQEEAYAYYDNLNGLVSNVYSYLEADFGIVDDAMMASATDDAVYTWQDNDINYLTNGVWSPFKTVNDGWGFFSAIRGANSFLELYDETVLERFQYNDDFDEISEKASMFPYEVRFLRAFYLFELAKRYGDMPLLTRTYTAEEINSVEKTSFDEIIEFIVAECDTVAKYLPAKQKEFWQEMGRATSGAAMSLKSRALLYAASPLHNPTGSVEKWERAAVAAYDVIKTGTYILPAINADYIYAATGGLAMLQSPQLIFERRGLDKTNSFETRNQPMGYEGAKGGNTPTQNLVDCYEFNDGTPFDWNNPEHLAKMYYDAAGKPTRDLRLYQNVLTNGATWQKTTVETYEGGKNKVLDGSTLTGYYLKKYMNPSVTTDPLKPNLIEHHYLLFRFAEIYLNYAEAAYHALGNKADAPLNAEVTMTAREAINTVRARAKMPNDDTTTDAKFIDRIRNERRVELAFEGHRFWDIRRWKIAGDKAVNDIYGVKITQGNSGYEYERVLLRTNKWDDKMYLFPFPQEEVYMNANLTQNKGW